MPHHVALLERRKLPALERFIAALVIDPRPTPDAHWRFVGADSRSTMSGAFHFRDEATGGERSMSPAAYVYRLMTGHDPVPPQRCHVLCPEPACCRPSHIAALTRSEYAAFRRKLARQAQGQRAYAAVQRNGTHRTNGLLAGSTTANGANGLRLTDRDVEAIRRSTEPSAALAQRYHVRRDYIVRIKRGTVRARPARAVRGPREAGPELPEAVRCFLDQQAQASEVGWERVNTPQVLAQIDARLVQRRLERAAQGIVPPNGAGGRLNGRYGG